MKRKGTGTDNIKRRGGHPVLNPNEEKFIVENLKTLGEWSYLVDSFDVRLIVKYYLDSSGKQTRNSETTFRGRILFILFVNGIKAKFPSECVKI